MHGNISLGKQGRIRSILSRKMEDFISTLVLKKFMQETAELVPCKHL